MKRNHVAISNPQECPVNPALAHPLRDGAGKAPRISRNAGDLVRQARP
jgi:hypothetical protein